MNVNVINFFPATKKLGVIHSFLISNSHFGGRVTLARQIGFRPSGMLLISDFLASSLFFTFSFCNDPKTANFMFSQANFGVLVSEKR